MASPSSCRSATMAPMLSDWMTSTGLAALKPAISALLLPPVPFIAFMLVGAAIARKRPAACRWLLVVGCAGVWFGCCNGAARWVEQTFLSEPTPLDAAQRDELKARAAAGQRLAIVVLGGGMEYQGLEYDSADLGSLSLKRLRYAVWLSRQTNIPIAASGGSGWGGSDRDVPPEAVRMAQVARDEYDTPVRWIEAASRDTHENATLTVPLMQAQGVRQIVLVTHGMHMARALREFRAAAAADTAAGVITVVPAAMGQGYPADTPVTRWSPTGSGLAHMQSAVHEVLGRMIASH